MPFNPFSALTSKLFAGGCIALTLVLIVQTVRLNQCQADNEALTAKLELARSANDAVIAAGEARQAQAHDAIEATKPKAAQRTQIIERLKVVPGNCPTPPEVAQAIGEGW